MPKDMSVIRFFNEFIFVHLLDTLRSEMYMISIDDKLIRIIKECGEYVECTIKYDTDLVQDLGYSSVNLVQLVVELEDEFNIEIDDNDLRIEILTKYCNLKKMIMRKIRSEV